MHTDTGHGMNSSRIRCWRFLSILHVSRQIWSYILVYRNRLFLSILFSVIHIPLLFDNLALGLP